MDTSFIKGIIPPILTPIDENERIDEAKLRSQVDYVIDNGVHGILAFGSNGEFYMVEDDEMRRGLEIMIDQAAGRIPLYLGIGAIKTRKCIELAKMAAKVGAAGISVLQPMFIKPTDTELYEHFSAIAKVVPSTPMLLYNNPGRVGYAMSYNLVVRLATDVANIVGMKDSSGDMTRTSEYIRLTRDLDFKVFGGKDTLIYSTMAHGGVGAVATMANFLPELVCSIYEKYVAGDTAGSLEAQYLLSPVRMIMDDASFPVATKDMANIVGRDIGKPFKPNLPSSDALIIKMKEELAKVNATIVL